MKRSSPLRTWTPLRRGKGLARTWMRRRPPKRIAREAVFKPYVEWLFAPGGVCIVCGTTKNLQGSHVGDGGTGQKRGRACDMVRMCGPGGNDCHGQWGERRGCFDGWTRDARGRAAATWRVVHWEAFVSWVGIELTHGYTPTETAALLACEVAIRVELVQRSTERAAA